MYTRLTDAIFDPFFYAQQANVSGSEVWLRAHFDKIGRRMGYSPGPMFDVSWYLSSNKDLSDSGICPYDHFVKWGCKEGRSPAAIFDSEWYRTHEMGKRDKTNPFLHFLEVGRASLARPGPFFWPKWYNEKQADAGAPDPYVHYLTGGWAADKAPNPLFDFAYFRSKYPDFRGEPIGHISEEIKGNPMVSTHPLFDPQHYQMGLDKIGNSAGSCPLVHYLSVTSDAGVPDPHPLFRSSYYRANRGGDCSSHALLDYLEMGPKHLLDPHPLFSKSYYYKNAPDVYFQGIDALVHYVSSGDREGRPFHPLFDVNHYVAQMDASGSPLLDYTAHGMANRKSIRAPETVDHRIHSHSAHRHVTAIPNSSVLSRQKDGALPTIGIFAHIFHLDCAEEIISAANNSPSPQTRLFVSTDTPQKAARLDRLARTLCKHPFEVRSCPNRGRDIAPFLVGFSDRLREVEVACHIHSKRSLHVAGGLDDWRRYLIDSTLGTPETVLNILHLLGQDGIGAVAPDHYSGVVDLIQWGGNFQTANALMKMMGQQLDRDGFLDLPAGSMFWFRTAALKPLLDLRLDYLHFDPEVGQVDGTLAHAIERLFLPVVEAAGFSYITSEIAGPELRVPENVVQNEGGNRLRPMKSDFGSAYNYFPHAGGYLTRASDVRKPRMNLLIPTADRAKAYAGVSAALEVFGAINDNLQNVFDARIIATDVPIPAGTPAPKGFEISPLEGNDREGIDVLVDGTRRVAHPISIRENDVFVSTAWWTAHQARQLMKSQTGLFGQSPERQVYLIQDYENGFEPWSTAWSLADATYRSPECTIPVFNTEDLAGFFRENGYFETGHILHPGINATFQAAIKTETEKEKIVLLYARPHAKRNCLEFLDLVARQSIEEDPEFWNDWRFIAIGEDFGPGAFAPNSPIEILGRLSLDDYAELSSRAALAISLMVSPHPSYPPLEMAAAGVQVLTNRFQTRDSSRYHENIASFLAFDPEKVAGQLKGMATNWVNGPDVGWNNRPKIDWFFDGQTNLDEIARNLAQDILEMCGVDAPSTRWKKAS